MWTFRVNPNILFDSNPVRMRESITLTFVNFKFGGPFDTSNYLPFRDIFASYKSSAFYFTVTYVEMLHVRLNYAIKCGEGKRRSRYTTAAGAQRVELAMRQTMPCKKRYVTG